MACDEIEHVACTGCGVECKSCEYGIDVLDCDKAKQLRCKLLDKMEELLCAPYGPIEMEGVRYESKSVALRALREMIDWTYLICERANEDEPMIAWAGPERCNWWGSCCR